MESASNWHCFGVCGQHIIDLYLLLLLLDTIHVSKLYFSDSFYLLKVWSKQNLKITTNPNTYFIEEEESVEKCEKEEKIQICRGNQYLFQPHYS